MGQGDVEEQEGKGLTIALKIDDVRQFTNKLFVRVTFDKFLMRGATTVTYSASTIDGHIKQGCYTEAGLEENRIEDLSSWVVLKPFCFSLIKGKKLPRSFQTMLQIASAGVEAFLGRSGLAVPVEQITELYVNTRHEERQLTCVVGMSVNFFTLSKLPDREWDETVRQSLRSAEIACVEEQKQESGGVIVAKLYFRYRVMGSSKTANVLMVDCNYHERGEQAPLVKPKVDSKDRGRVMRSRIGLEKEGTLLEELVEMAGEEMRKYDCIITDEAQFATKTQVELSVYIVDDLDMPVTCYGLRMDSRREPLEGSLWLVAWADRTGEIKTMCWCRKTAVCNARTGEDGRMVQPGGQIVMGGNDKYTALYRKHHWEGNLGE